MKTASYKKATCLLLLVVFVLASGMTSFAEEEQKLVGKTININLATVDDWAQVPLISRDLAERIVEYRDDTGDFQVIEELLQIDGFTRKMLRRLKPFLLLEGIGGDECTC